MAKLYKLAMTGGDAMIRRARLTRSIASSEAKAKLALLLDDVYSHGTRYIIQRFDSPRAVLIPLADYERLLAAEAAGIEVVRESGVSYGLGVERTDEEIATLLGVEYGKPSSSAE